MKTYSAKPTDVTRAWYILDASETTLGRVSTKAAKLLIGKEKPMFTHHIDCGDNVIIINASKLVVTGDKLNKKMYYHHSGFSGGLNEIALKDKMDMDPTDVLIRSIRGMLPVNKLRDDRLARLKIYTDVDHKHDPQKPVKLSLREGK